MVPLVPLVPGTTLSVPVSLSPPQYSAGTTCRVFGTTQSMCWYPWYHSLCASKSLSTPILCWYHMSSLWYHSIYVLVPLGTLGTPRYPWYPWYHSLCASKSLCTPVLCWYNMLSLWYHSLYVLVPLGTLGTPRTTLSVPVSLSVSQYSAGATC